MNDREDMLNAPVPREFTHDADQVLGRIRNDGGWDRRYRNTWPIDEPKVDPMREVVKILGLTIFVLAMWVVIFGVVAIAQASRP